MSDQVPVVPADGAVAAAVDPPVVAPPAPADAAGDNNAQNANDNVVPCICFFGAFFGLGVVGLLAWLVFQLLAWCDNLHI